MITQLDDRHPIARKVHGCNACLGRIEVGERYRNQTLVEDGIYNWKCHLLCDAIYWQLHRELELFEDEMPEPSQVRDRIQAVLDMVASGA